MSVSPGERPAAGRARAAPREFPRGWTSISARPACLLGASPPAAALSLARGGRGGMRAKRPRPAGLSLIS